MHNQIQKPITATTQNLHAHIKRIADLADIDPTTPYLVNQLRALEEYTHHAITLAILTNRLNLLLARHHPSPPQDTPPYRPSSPHLPTTPATLSN